MGSPESHLELRSPLILGECAGWMTEVAVGRCSKPLKNLVHSIEFQLKVPKLMQFLLRSHESENYTGRTHGACLIGISPACD